MWTSGAVDKWITVAAQSPRQAPGLSLTPPGDHPAAGMRRSRRPAARLRSAGERNGARRWPRPDRTSSDAPYPGCANEPRPGPAAEPGYCGLPHGAEAQPGRRAGEAGSRARNAGQEAAQARKAAGSAHAELDRARQGPGRQAQVREDAARDQARPPAASEAQIAAAENARARRQARARHAEAEPSVPAPTATRRPGRPVLDNPQAQPAAGAVRETWRQATTSAEHPDLDGQHSDWPPAEIRADRLLS